ncbi:sulfotransferase 1A1-like isoform X1 [Haliotis rubra]|uniref:sulfotransferase 1A1-like isoform X1 n=2 Tax=Haliotis rubra TaxID=36100 RepID=UPI001EE5A180|nr:sulfotransferase 1A1-like isoform X1 [Haliotis rubra]
MQLIVMSRVTVEDAGGDTLFQIEHNGNLYPNFPNINSITNIHNLPIRDDDIFICAYPKSGTHWVWEVTRLLVTGQTVQDNVEKGAGMIEYMPQEDVTSLPSPRILNSHFKLKLLPQDILKKRCKILYVMRNPKDIVVSYYNFMRGLPHYKYTGKWENYMQYFILGKFSYGSWFDYVLEFEDMKRSHPDLPVLTLHYEDLKEDPLREIKRVNEFLETGRSAEFLLEAIEVASFGNMKQKKSNQVTYRKGVVGDWKNWFTVAQNEWFDQLYQEKMADSDIKVRFTLP